MPYVIDDDNCIHKENADGTLGDKIPGGCHNTRDEAEAQMAALYSAENKDIKVGRRNSNADMSRIQAVHDMSKQLGAECDSEADFPAKGMKTSVEEALAEIDSAFRGQFQPQEPMIAPGMSYWIMEHDTEAHTLVVECESKYYRVGYVVGNDGYVFDAREQWQEVTSRREWIAKSLAREADDTLIVYGGTVKALGDNKIGGYLVRFGDKDNPDLEGDYFTKDTDFGELEETAVFLHHRQPINANGVTFAFDKAVGRGKLSKDDAGILLEALIDMRGEYEDDIKKIYGETFMEAVRQGALAFSSGTAGHLVDRVPVGKANWIKSWPLGLDASLTPIPAEPRTFAVPLKSLSNVLTAMPNRNEGQVMPGKEKPAAIKSSMEDDMTEEIKSAETPQAPPVEAKSIEIDYEKLASLVAEKLDAPLKSKAVPAVLHSENVGDPDPFKSVSKWLIGNDDVKALGALNARLVSRDEIEFLPSKSFKAAYQEGTASEGGTLVPNDFYAGIIAKRDQASIARRAGARVFRTSRDVIDIPYEDTSVTNFTLTAEEAAYNEAEATFGNAQAIVYKYTKMNKISEELIEDDATNLDAFLTDAFGRAWGLAENAATLVGTGSSQPQGVFVGGTVGYTFADTNGITAAEIASLFWSLGDAYHEGATWNMRGATMGYLQGLTGNPFSFQMTPAANTWQNVFYGNKPYFLSDSAAAIATTAKTIMIGNWNFYALVERHGIIIQRNPYLYQANGQIGIFAKVRMGGVVLQSEAFKWGIQT